MGSFNIRVYGILIIEDEILVSDELVKGNAITKFPGGGLEFGEGTIDCLKREFREEMNMEIEVENHFYTTDFFQPSAFHNDHQIISIYYTVRAVSLTNLEVKTNIFDFVQDVQDQQNFRWIPLKTISSADFTLPIDKVVGDLLKGMKMHKK